MPGSVCILHEAYCYLIGGISGHGRRLRQEKADTLRPRVGYPTLHEYWGSTTSTVTESQQQREPGKVPTSGTNLLTGGVHLKATHKELTD